MKKIVSLLLTLVMSATLLTACGDPLYDDFSNYMNVEMTEINENYDKIKAEAATWENIDDDAALEASLKDVLLPLAEDSLAKLENVKPETEEVKALKDKYVTMMTAYRDGFAEVLAAIQEVNEEKLIGGQEKLETAMALLDEYNAGLEALAAEVGGEIEY